MRKGMLLGLLGAVIIASAGLAMAAGALAAGETTARAGAVQGPLASATTGAVSFVDAHDATLLGTITPTGSPPVASTARVYFQIGTRRTYELQSVDQGLALNNGPTTVHVSLAGLKSNQLFHYRLLRRPLLSTATASVPIAHSRPRLSGV